MLKSKILLLFFPFSFLLAAVSLYPEKGQVPQMIISNDFLELSVDTQEAHFILKSIKPRETYLTYQGKVPSTSFATIRINDVNYAYGSSKGQFISKPVKIADNTIFSEWRIGNIFVDQFLILTSSPYYADRMDTLKMIYKVRCSKNDQPHVGLRFCLDTYLGENDGVPFFMPGVGRIFGYKQVSHNDIPPYGYTLDTTKDSNIRFQISFPEDVKKRPDEMVMASWELFKDHWWDIPEAKKDTFKKDILSINDSAVSLYWQPELLAQDAEKTYEFYYGLYNGDVFSTNNLKIFLSMPDKSRITPFFINLNLKNNSELVFQDIKIRVEPSVPADFQFLTENEFRISDLKSYMSRDLSFKIMPQEHSSGYYDFSIFIQCMQNGAMITNRLVKTIRIENYRPVLLSSDEMFSPNQDNYCDKLSISFSSEMRKKSLLIRNSAGEEVRSILFASNVPSFAWDGTDSSGRTVPDGMYSLSVSDPEYPGYDSLTNARHIIVDTVPPAVHLVITNKVINMKKEPFWIIDPEVRDTNGIRNLELRIFNNDLKFDFETTLFKQGGNFSYSWNFTDNAGQQALPEENYFIRLVAMDQACNTTVFSDMVFLIAKTNINKIFPDINFKFNSSFVEERYFGILDEIVAMINNKEIKSLELIGHTDNIGTESYNKDLSIKRARAVKNYIIKKIESKFKDIIYVGKGFHLPKADNTQEEGRQINRRVEIIIKK